MLINGVEFEVDLLDADEAERIEKIIDETGDEFRQRDKDFEKMRDSESIRAQCGIIFQMFDRILGTGAHEKIFGSKTNLETCLDTFAQFLVDLHNNRNDKLKTLPKKWNKIFGVPDNNEPAV